MITLAIPMHHRGWSSTFKTLIFSLILPPPPEFKRAHHELPHREWLFDLGSVATELFRQELHSPRSAVSLIIILLPLMWSLLQTTPLHEHFRFSCSNNSIS